MKKPALNLAKLAKFYDQGKNISQLLRQELDSKHNTPEIIQVSYDLQAGSYIERAKSHRNFVTKWSQAIINEILNLKIKSPFSIMEAGVGEATTMAPVVSGLKSQLTEAWGFDLSWSRLKYAQQYLSEHHLNQNAHLFMADLFNISLADNAIDVVYTAHSVEPNGGDEKPILAELYRVASRYLVLLEPDYFFANPEAKKRMKQHGFITKLPAAAKALGYNVITHRLFEVAVNPLNPTGVMIIKKSNKVAKFGYQCPISKQPLQKFEDAYFSPKSLLAYPSLAEIPCLVSQSAVVATHFLKTQR